MEHRELEIIPLLNVEEAPDSPATSRPRPFVASGIKNWLTLRVKLLLRSAFRYMGIDILNRKHGLSLMDILKDVSDLRSFRTAAEEEIAQLKVKTLTDRDQLRVQSNYLSALQSIVTHQKILLAGRKTSIGIETHQNINVVGNAQVHEYSSERTYPSCRWIEGGLSFVPGHVRVCPNCNAQGGVPGLVAFTEGRLPVDEIVESKEIIRQGNKIDGFGPCTKCAYRVNNQWEPKSYNFDIICISHATACNLACNYCHTISEEQYLQNPKLVPRLYPTIKALIDDSHLAPDSLIQWGGGEPTILREFPQLFRLLERHGAYSEVYTSGVHASEVLMDGLANNTAGVMISLDAGTAETYVHIKGRPVFDRVVRNVGRYARTNPGRTLLKMILFEENLEEVSEFLDIAERTGVRIVCFDTPMYQDHVDSKFIDAAALFCDEAERRGLECRTGEVGIVFNPEDKIEERVARKRHHFERNLRPVTQVQ